MNKLLTIVGLSVVFCGQLIHAQTTTFTYQGRLNNNSGPVNGSYDLQFAVYDAVTNGVAVSSPLTNAATSVSNGLFTVQLDFGANVFTGAARWLDIAVRTNGTGSFSPLTPRQPVTSLPYAIRAANAQAIAGTNITGAIPDARLSSNIPRLNGTNTFTGMNAFDTVNAGYVNTLNFNIIGGGALSLRGVHGSRGGVRRSCAPRVWIRKYSRY